MQVARTNALLAGAVAVVGISLYAVLSGQVVLAPNTTHVQVGVAAPGSVQVPFEALLSAPLLHSLGLDAGAQYSVGSICALPLDGGDDPGKTAIPGAIIVWSDPTEVLCGEGWPAVDLYLASDPAPPWVCACSSGLDCDFQQEDNFGNVSTVSAPRGITMNEGRWAGDGCIRKPCFELAGVSTWPAACPLE